MGYLTPTPLGIRRPDSDEPAELDRLLGENADDTDTAIQAAAAAVWARASLTSNQSIANNTPTPVAFNASSPNGGFWSAGQPSRLTVPDGLGGLYLAVAQACWGGSAGNRLLHIEDQNETRWGLLLEPAAANHRQQVTALVPLAAGQWVQPIATHTHGSAINLMSSATAPTLMSLTRIGTL